MKFNKLEIRNIASIESATIDFSSPQFADESLFLIYGETGSGKSTILDAICLALYKKTPRLETASGNNYVDEAFTKRGDGEVVSKTDAVEQYIRRGTRPGEDCYSELSFTGNDGLDYVARLQFNINRAGNIGTTEWTLTCPDGSMLHGKGQGNAREEISDKVVSPKINELVGLTYKQFCRTTMLAQGEFTKLLKASEAERCQILEKITDTGRFKVIGQALSERYSACKKTRDLLVAQLAGVPSADPEAEKALRDEKWEQMVQAANLAILRRCYQTQADWLDRDAALENSLKEAQSELKNATNLVSKSEFLSLKKDVSDWRMYEAERQAVASLDKIISEREDAKRKWGQMNDSFSLLLAGIRWLEANLKDEEKAALNRMNELSSLENKKNEAQAALAGFDLSALTAKKASQEQIKLYAQALKEALKIHKEKLLLRYNKKIELESLESKENEANMHYQEILKAWQEARIKTAHAKKLYEDTQAKLGHAKALIAEMHDGDECPVCHNTYHALDTEDILMPTRIDWEKAQTEEEEAEKACKEAQSAWLNAKNDASSARTELSTIMEPDFLNALANRNEAARKAMLNPESPSLEAEADGQIAEADEKMKQLEADIAKATPLQKAYTEAVEAYNDMVNADTLANHLLSKKQTEYTDAREALETIANAECTDLRLKEAPAEPAQMPDIKKLASELKLRYFTWYNHAIENRKKKQEAQAIIDASEADEQRIRALLASYSAEVIKKSEDYISSCEERYTKAQSTHDSWASQLEKHRSKSRTWLHTDSATIIALKQQADSRYLAATQRIGAINANLDTIEANRLTAEQLKLQIEDKERQLELLKMVCSDFGGDSFSRAVQNYLLGEMLAFANEYLALFTRRYELFVQDGSTAILVKDTYCGGIARSVDMLSGGESFMISLSLALGLVRMGSATFRVETIFIDEGFGTLDANSLEMVISTLEKLQQLSGRQVGIISHVEELRKRIALRIAVCRKAGSSGISEVTVEEGRGDS